MKNLTPQSLGLPEKFDKFRDVQIKSLEFLDRSEKRFKVLLSPTGSGKSICNVAAAVKSGIPTCIVTEQRALQTQYMDDFSVMGMVDIRGRNNYTCSLREGLTCDDGYASNCPYRGSVQCPSSLAEIKAAGSNLVVTNYAKWCSAKKWGTGMNHFKQVIFDEGHCFPPDTTVLTARGYKKIVEIQKGDRVISMNPSGEFNESTVAAVMSRVVSELIRLRFSDGSVLVTTTNHPIYTTQGWKRADEVTGFMLCSKYDNTLQELQQSHRDNQELPTRVAAEERIHILQSPVLRSLGWQVPESGNGTSSESRGIYKDDTKKSNEERTNSKESVEGSYRESPEQPGGERQYLPASSCISQGIEMADGSDYRNSSSFWIPKELQSRYSSSPLMYSNRGRWEESWCSEEAGGRSEKGGYAYWVRLDSVEILKRGSNTEFEELCPDGLVYNFEVELNHTYVADGIVVHNCAYSALANAMQVILNHKEVEETLKCPFPLADECGDILNWKVWARAARPLAEKAMVEAQARITGVTNPKPSWVRHFTHMRNLVRRISIIATANAQEWIVDAVEGGYQFDPIRPGRYAESALFMRVPSVIITSATIRPKSMFMLGVGKDKFDFLENDSEFDPRRCPLYYNPTMRVDKNTAHDLSRLWAKFDMVMSRRRDRKGIIHTISYNRREAVVENSRFAQYMYINAKGQPTARMIEDFKAAGPGAVLVSPSVGTGYDFPGDTCEWQIVCKIPFPDGRSKIVKARQEDDPEYGPYQAMQDLVQTLGRGMRSKTDQCESFIFDDHFKWFLPRYGHLAPKSFHLFKQEVDILPPPLPKL